LGRTPPENGLPAVVVDIGRRDVADPFVVPLVVVEANKIRHRRSEEVRTRVDQQIDPGLEGFVEALELAIGLRVMPMIMSKKGSARASASGSGSH